MAFQEDLSDFFDSDDGFAVVAVYNNQPVKIIYDADYVDPYGVSGSTPHATAMESDFSAVKNDDVITVNGLDHKIKEWKPDGTGLIVLKLEK